MDLGRSKSRETSELERRATRVQDSSAELL